MKARGRRLPMYQCTPADRQGNFIHCFHAAAAFVDPVIEREVLAALTPASIQAVLDVINDSLADQDAIQQSRKRQLQRAKDAVDEARRRYEAVDLKNDLVKKDLEESYQSARKTHNELDLRLRADAAAAAVPFSPADAAGVKALAADIPALWHAPTTTNEDRKELLQTVISRVVVLQKTEEAIELKIERVGRPPVLRRAYRPKGVDQLVAELYGSGITALDAIVEVLRTRGVTNAFGRPISKQVVWKALQRLGLNQGRQWVQALLIIRQLVLDRWNRRMILAKLRADGPRHPLGEWTARRVESAITRLRLGTVPSEVPPLPPECKVAPSIETPHEAVQLIIAGRTSRPRRPWRDIVTDLNARGLTTATGKSFKVPSARCLFHNWKRKGAVKEASREQDPGR